MKSIAWIKNSSCRYSLLAALTIGISAVFHTAARAQDRILYAFQPPFTLASDSNSLSGPIRAFALDHEEEDADFSFVDLPSACDSAPGVTRFSPQLELPFEGFGNWAGVIMMGFAGDDYLEITCSSETVEVKPVIIETRFEDTKITHQSIITEPSAQQFTSAMSRNVEHFIGEHIDAAVVNETNYLLIVQEGEKPYEDGTLALIPREGTLWAVLVLEDEATQRDMSHIIEELGHSVRKNSIINSEGTRYLVGISTGAAYPNGFYSSIFKTTLMALEMASLKLRYDIEMGREVLDTLAGEEHFSESEAIAAVVKKASEDGFLAK